MERRTLADDEIAALVAELPGWKVTNGRLQKTFQFKTFAQAMVWMVGVGFHAEKLNHHPDWTNRYNKVSVELVTHDLGAISTWDFELAKRMEELA